MWPMASYVWAFCSSWIGGYTCKVSPQSVQPLQRFLKVKNKTKHDMAAESRDRWSHQFFLLWTILTQDDPQKVSYWSDVAFSIYNMSYKIKKYIYIYCISITLIPHELYLPCAKFQFFSLMRFQRCRGPKMKASWIFHHKAKRLA